MKNDTERGLLGAWARKERLALGLSVEQVVTRLSDRGAAVDPAYIRAIESGSKRPRLDSEIVDALAAVYRSRPVEPHESSEARETTPDLARLLDAMTRQAEQQAELIGELRRQNDLLMRLLASPAAGGVDPSEQGSGPLPRPGLARATRMLVGEASGTAPEPDPAPALGTGASPRRSR